MWRGFTSQFATIAFLLVVGWKLRLIATNTKVLKFDLEPLHHLPTSRCATRGTSGSGTRLVIQARRQRYGPAALLAERQAWQPARIPLNLEGLLDLDDLTQRLRTTREQEMTARTALIQDVAAALWGGTINEERQGLRAITLGQENWAGQMVSEGQQMVYLSVFNDPVPQAKKAEGTDDDEDA